MVSFNELAAETFAQALDVAQRVGDSSAANHIQSLQQSFAELPAHLHWDLLDEVQFLREELLSALPDLD